jgi:hypothetical protein
MDANGFDTLARLIGSRAPRRAALGLAVTGVFTAAVPDVEAARCWKRWGSTGRFPFHPGGT